VLCTRNAAAAASACVFVLPPGCVSTVVTVPSSFVVTAVVVPSELAAVVVLPLASDSDSEAEVAVGIARADSSRLVGEESSSRSSKTVG
jgi:hypothetical protein